METFLSYSGGAAPLQDLRRDIHGFIASKANINIEVATSYGGETFLVTLNYNFIFIVESVVCLQSTVLINHQLKSKFFQK
jgi:hypothetical protein